MGFSFAYREGGGKPVRARFPLAKSMNGAGTRPAARMRAGDVVAYTTVSALTTSSAKVVRPLLEADKTAHYEDGSSHRCGILGICESPVATNSSGVPIAETQTGGNLSKTPSLASMNPLDSNGHGQQVFLIATPDTVFKAELGTAAASLAAYLALKGQLAGLTFTNATGGSDYTVNTSDTGEDLLLVIADVDPKDSTFKTVFVKVVDEGLSPTGSYCQSRTGYPYTAQ
jgi:hypothetical protein